MLDFYKKVLIYFLSFVISIYGLNALDFNRFIKKGRVASTYVLYFVLACVLAYLFGQFLMDIIYLY